MQKMLFPCFLFMEFLKSVVLKDGGVNVIPGNNIKTTTHSPSNIPAGDFTANKTGNHFKKPNGKRQRREFGALRKQSFGRNYHKYCSFICFTYYYIGLEYIFGGFSEEKGIL